MSALYPAASGSLVHLSTRPGVHGSVLCGWRLTSAEEPLRPIHMRALCDLCARTAQDSGMLTTCVGCLRLVTQPSDHAQGCPTGQNGNPNYE